MSRRLIYSFVSVARRPSHLRYATVPSCNNYSCIDEPEAHLFIHSCFTKAQGVCTFANSLSQLMHHQAGGLVIHSLAQLFCEGTVAWPFVRHLHDSGLRPLSFSCSRRPSQHEISFFFNLYADHWPVVDASHQPLARPMILVSIRRMGLRPMLRC